MDLVPADVNARILQFIQKYSIQQGKASERPWGSYDLALRIPVNGNIFITGKTFGFGYTTEEASVITLYELANRQPPEQSFVDWLGVDQFNELVNVVKNEPVRNIAEIMSAHSEERP